MTELSREVNRKIFDIDVKELVPSIYLCTIQTHMTIVSFYWELPTTGLLTIYNNSKCTVTVSLEFQGNGIPDTQLTITGPLLRNSANMETTMI